MIQAPSTAFNPTLSSGVIDRARTDDPESAASEWNAEFRSDISSFLDDELIESAIDYDRPRELPPRRS